MSSATCNLAHRSTSSLSREFAVLTFLWVFSRVFARKSLCGLPDWDEADLDALIERLGKASKHGKRAPFVQTPHDSPSPATQAGISELQPGQDLVVDVAAGEDDSD